jgi:hypothetical protein
VAPEHRRCDALLKCVAPVIFLLIGVLFFSPFLLRPDMLIYPASAPYSDLTTTHWPNALFLVESLRNSHQLPLWRPLIMSGTPFAANPLSGMFYPPHILFIVLPLTPAFNVLLPLHIALAGLTMYILLRAGLKASRLAGIFCGLAYMFAPKTLAHLGAGHVGLVEALAWLPLALTLLMVSWREGRLLPALGAGLVLALQTFADVRVAFYTALLLAGYACAELVRLLLRGGPDRRRIAFRGLLGSGLGAATFALVAAIELLPLLELAPLSSRQGLSLTEAEVFSLPWASLLGLFIPARGGNHEWVTYSGLLPVILAGLTLTTRRNFKTLFLGGGGLLALLLALGSNAPLFPLVYHLLPGLSWLRVPSRFWFLALFALIILAGLGVEQLAQEIEPGHARRRLALALFAFLIFSLLLGGGLSLISPPLLVSGLHLAVFSLLSVGVIMAWAHDRVPRAFASATLLAVLLTDLWLVDYSFFRTVSPEEAFSPGEPVARYLVAQRQAGGGQPFRVYSPSYSLPQQVAARWRIEQADGVDPTQLASYIPFMRLAGGYGYEGYAVTIPPFPEGEPPETVWRHALPNAALLGLLNVRYVVAAFPVEGEGLTLEKVLGATYVYRNERAMPRAWVMDRVEVVESVQDVYARLTGVDLARVALVEGAKPLSGPGRSHPATIEIYTPNLVVVHADLESQGLLVLSEVWYPGWVAREGGALLPIYKVDGLLRGVYLGPGSHRVEFTYEPLSLRLGALMSGLGILAVALCATIWAYRQRAKARYLTNNQPQRTYPGRFYF